MVRKLDRICVASEVKRSGGLDVGRVSGDGCAFHSSRLFLVFVVHTLRISW